MPRPRIRTSMNRSGRSNFSIKAPLPQTILQQVKEIEPPPLRDDWQRDAYSFVEAIGEVGYLLNLKANTLAQCGVRCEVKVKGADEWVETDDPRVLRAAAALKGPEGGVGELLRQAILHYEIAGEGFLFGQPIRDEMNQPAGLIWEFLSTIELRVESDGRVIRNAWGGSKGKEEVEVDAYVARLHHRDSVYSERADSPMRRVLAICRELVLLTQVVDAITKSRLSAGLFFVPWEVSFGPENEWENPGDPDTGEDEFEGELSRHLNDPIEDRTSPSSLLPMLMRGPAHIDGSSTKDLMGLVDIARPLDPIYKELREEALKRLAAGLDIPPEYLIGKSSLSGLGGGNVVQAIDDDFLSKHVIPPGERIVSFLTTAYLRPVLTIFEQLTPEEADWFRFSLDASAITSDTDLSANSTTGHGLGIVSDEAWVRYNGLQEEDIPEDEEVKRHTLERLLFAQPTLGPAILPVLYPNDPDIEKAVKDWQVGQSAPGGAQAPPPGVPPTPMKNRATEPLLADLDPAVISVLLAAADRDMDRGLERAANRLISRLNGVDKAAAERFRSAKRTEVLSMAGSELARKAGLGRDELFSGCWDDLSERVTEWLTVALVEMGADPYIARQRSERAAGELANQLTLHAGTALEREMTVGGNGFKVPSELVESALAAGDLSRR